MIQENTIKDMLVPLDRLLVNTDWKEDEYPELIDAVDTLLLQLMNFPTTYLSNSKVTDVFL